MENKLKKIFNYYGEEHQLGKLREELNEAVDEIDNIMYLSKPKPMGNKDFQGEVADVLVMCMQFALKYPDIQDIVTFKINRQLDRIKKDIKG